MKTEQTLLKKSKNSAAFAQQHDFDTTFQKRIDHLISTVEYHSGE